jgi:peptidyl-prolyl cis-trans isomerase C
MSSIPVRTLCLSGLLVSLLLLSACKSRGDAASPTLIRVDGRTVTIEQFRKDLDKTLSTDPKLSAEERSDLERSFLVQIIDRDLTLAEAERLGISILPEEVEAALLEHRRDYPADTFDGMLKERSITLDQWRRELEEGLLVEKVIRQDVYSRVTVDAEEIAEFYRENQDEFDRPPQVRARQIVVSNETEGEKILALLRQGGSFEELAAQVSLSPDSEQGGDLGYFARGEMPPEFDAVVFTLPVGKISDLVKSEYGYHIFRVEERRAAVRLSLADVREQVLERVRMEKEERSYQEWLQDLRGRAAIEVNWSLL